jgi:hypothetical protein
MSEHEKVGPLTMSVPEAGWKYFGIGRNASYEAAKRGDIPFIQVGKLQRVPIAAMDAMLALPTSNSSTRSRLFAMKMWGNRG